MVQGYEEVTVEGARDAGQKGRGVDQHARPMLQRPI